jgi:hypothetical protein
VMLFIWTEGCKRGGIGKPWDMTGLNGGFKKRKRYLTRLNTVTENIKSCRKVSQLLEYGMIMILEWTILVKITRTKIWQRLCF